VQQPVAVAAAHRRVAREQAAGDRLLAVVDSEGDVERVRGRGEGEEDEEVVRRAAEQRAAEQKPYVIHAAIL
jgi:hypothetical protein